MALVDYTSYAECRAALGVNDEELEDATLALDIYAYGLLSELRGIDDDLPATFTTIKALGLGSRTTAQQRLYEAVVLFAPYAVAGQLASSLPLFAAKTITDGKAAVSRDAAAPYLAAASAARALYDRYRTQLTAAVQVLDAGTATAVALPLLFSIAVPATDPVTG